MGHMVSCGRPDGLAVSYVHNEGGVWCLLLSMNACLLFDVN